MSFSQRNDRDPYTLYSFYCLLGEDKVLTENERRAREKSSPLGVWAMDYEGREGVTSFDWREGISLARFPFFSSRVCHRRQQAWSACCAP